MNSTVSLEEIPYQRNSCDLFERIRDLPGAAFLDSSAPHSQIGRYDILTASPRVDVPPPPPAYATETQWRTYFATLGVFHSEHFGTARPASHDIPFSGGVLGYIGYDCGNALNKVTDSRTIEATRASSVNLRAYDWAVIQDHLLARAVLVTQPAVGAAARCDLLSRLRCQIPRSKNSAVSEPFSLQKDFKANISEQQYRQSFEKIQAYIQAGDCYQVNLAQRFTAPYTGDPWLAYRRLRESAAAPFSAYIAMDNDDAVMSLSPERFLALHGQHVQTSPIKGTRPRYKDNAADQLAAQELHQSAKDRAENLMIVDLLRNDLGRSCVPGSIHVDALFEVQSFPTVHHLVSTISGELQSGRDAYDLLRDSFPGGSITGAPKRRSMEIITELEPHARQAYCGSVLYISADGRMDSNIAIRTLLCNDGQVHCWGGGGIVADSVWQQEYQETYDKVGKFLTLLEQL